MPQITLLLCIISLSVVLKNVQCQTQDDHHADLLDKTARSLEIVEDTITNIVDAIGKMDVGSMFAKLSKGLSMLGPVFSAFSAILSIVSIFVPQAESPEMKALRKGFEKVNTRLDGLKGVINEVKLIAEISSAKSGLSRAFDSIDIMEVELLIAQKRGSKQAWGYFIKRYENDYQHAADSIYFSLSDSEWDADFRFDILDLFRKKFKCSPLALTRVCLVGMQSINRGIAVEAAYLGAIKYPSRVKKLQKEWHRRLETLRTRCGTMINECEIQWEEHASRLFDEYYNQKIHSEDPAKFANNLQQSLSMTVPSKMWGVFTSLDHSYGPMDFMTTAQNGNRWKVRVAENGRNVIVWHSQKEEPEDKMQKFSDNIEDGFDYITKSTSCKWDFQGPLYHATSGLILDRAVKEYKDVNVIVAKKSKGPHMAGPKTRIFKKEYPITFCLTEEFVLYAFL